MNQKSKRLLIELLKPEKVVLFGSHAWGKPTEDSDVDLLVIKESDKTRTERQHELDSLLLSRILPLDLLVYTTDEIEEQINKKRNLFLEDIIRNGLVLYSKNKSHEINITLARPLTIVP